MTLAALFLASLLAATIVPLSSEAALAAAVSTDPPSWVPFLAVATLGNTLGSVVNWALGRALLRFRDRRWFPVGPEALDRAQRRFARWGAWSLLLAWVPWVGDPLTVAAGAFGVRIGTFVLLVATGKLARYLAVTWGVLEALSA